MNTGQIALGLFIVLLIIAAVPMLVEVVRRSRAGR